MAFKEPKPRANGGSTVRLLHVFLTQVVQRRKVFYDLDRYLRVPGMLGVVTDAVKLFKNHLIVLSNETWCRDWCVVAITSGFATKTPVQTLTIGSGRVSSFDADYSISIMMLWPSRLQWKDLRHLASTTARFQKL